ncbi:MAG: CBS domain-containing protein [Anaerolineales bacterium]|nr:CBS domain-containing protein [Anaerolineales bacterium]MCA9929513.1 CBS domain-containing protein [Anaerolineales bacterium]
MSLEKELQNEQVAHLDLSGFSQIAKGATVKDALNQMRKDGHNVCLVTEKEHLVGILTDRDVITKIAAQPEMMGKSVEDVMTKNPITVTPQTSAKDALWLMDEKHIRNLPVVKNDGTIIGDMTHQAVISFLADRYPIEVLNRPPRPDQFPMKPEGGD